MEEDYYDYYGITAGRVCGAELIGFDLGCFGLGFGGFLLFIYVNVT